MSWMRGLRIAACAVAAASFLFLGLRAFGVGDINDDIPSWLIPFIAIAL